MSQEYTLDKSSHLREHVLENAVNFLRRLPKSNSWKITIKRAVKERSNPQNRSLFGVAYPALEQATGFTKDQLHTAFCKRHFGTVVETDICGRTQERAYRTTTTGPNGEPDIISAESFSRFYDMVQQVGAEAGVDVPSPDSFHNAPTW